MLASRLIVALDLNQKERALALLEQLNPEQCAIKIGHELFTLLGPEFVKFVVKKGFKVFLDLKFYDIPNTVSKACYACKKLGIWMINVHASGGLAMMQAARTALNETSDPPLLIAVTVLTSVASDDLSQMGLAPSLENHVINLSIMAKESSLDGVVCSAFEVPLVKEACGTSFLTVTPGIRLVEHPHDDQVRVATISQALTLGSDYLVVGRPITHSQNPALMVKEIISLIGLYPPLMV